MTIDRPAAPDPIIRCRELVHVYPGGTRALDGVDLEIRAGERVAIVGQNGSGKSTLVLHLNGLLKPTAGTVEIDGRATQGRRVAELARRVGVVFQDPDRQIFAGKVRTEVAFGARNVGLRDPALSASVKAGLEAVGLSDAAATNPYDLGYSRRKLLALASILAMATPVVVLDEPTTGQDARGVARIRDLVARLADEGRTVVTISHDMRFVAETFERVVVMGSGRVLLDGTPAEAFAERAWPSLRATNLEPTLAARLGAGWHAGETPTEASLVEALRARAG
ncbi:MAG TPA: ABC transporter ATP-binding protein [Candidatus Limnocylindrales bacterium]|nr:ABC transporter ATP-binding protein [Candidatus Limnocylindrales bacterium]